VTIAAAAFGVFVMAVPLMPAHWIERMSTIRSTVQDTETADLSVQGRFNAWYVYSQLALERPLTGGGFRAPEQLWVWQRYMPESDAASGAKAAHNNIFQVLGEHGFLGLAIYLMIVFLCLKNIASILVRTRHAVELRWARQLAIACGISMVAYLVAGMTVSIPYYDLFIILTVVVATLRRLVVRELAQQREERRAAVAIPGAPAAAMGRRPVEAPQAGGPAGSFPAARSPH
jgi:probable O-glycosylation ligase (exosortase A-associated)